MYSSTPAIVVTPSCNAPLVGWSAQDAEGVLDQHTPNDDDQHAAAAKHLQSNDLHLTVESRRTVNERDGPPDGGWGWVVVGCSLMISLIQDGVSYSFGLIYVELLNEFHASKSKTSWVNSLFLAVPLLAGPLASLMVERYGCRAMTMLGGLLGATGFVLSALVGYSIEILLLTFGVITGLGLALGYVTAVVGIAYWFDKRLSLANGLGVCGTGIGTFLMAPLTQLLIEHYAWRGTTLLLGGVFLQMCICGALMREPAYLILQKRNKSPKSTTVVLETAKEPCRRSLSPAPLQKQLLQHRHSLTYRGAMVCLQPWTEEGVDADRAASCPDLLLQVRGSSLSAGCAKRAAPKRPHYWLDAGLFLEPAFLLLSASTLLLFMCFIVPYLFLAEHMLKHGYTQAQAAALISVIGVPNTLAMVVLGWAGDKPWLPVSQTYSACLLVCGVSIFVMPLVVHTYAGLLTAVIFFGLSFAANYSFTPVLLVQLVEMDRFSAAYGLMLLVQGAGNLLGPPIAGWISDVTGSWDLAFFAAGVLTVISGGLTFLIPMYKKPLPGRDTPLPEV
ncbi:monocarboxylate transporter 14-like isoform X2 [Neocloeon triangulifer]|nr:monocarboxylate transporter 14-like isoform X2 [Neocloeon triangulifer]